MALSDSTVPKRNSTNIPHLQWGCDQLTAAGTINPGRCCTLGTGGTLTQSAAGDLASRVLGVCDSLIAIVSGEKVPLARGFTSAVVDDVVTPQWAFKVGDGGRPIRFLDSAASGGTIKTTGNGAAFTNQPANDGLEVVSSSAADTTQTLTVYGTTTGTDTVVVETVTLNGTSQVDFVKVDWGVVLAAELSAASAGTVTLREASANATVVAFTAGQLTKGIETVTAADQQAYNVAPTAVASDTTTKQIGIQGTDGAGATIYDSQALNNTTAVTMNTAFKRVTRVFTGDLESNRTVTMKTGAAEAEGLRIGTVLTAATAQNDRVGIFFGT